MDVDVETVLAGEMRAVPAVWGDGVGGIHGIDIAHPLPPPQAGISALLWVYSHPVPFTAPSPSLAGVAELADAPDSKSGAGNSVGVQVPPPAPLKNRPPRNCTDRVIAGRFRCVGHAIATGK